MCSSFTEFLSTGTFLCKATSYAQVSTSAFGPRFLSPRPQTSRAPSLWNPVIWKNAAVATSAPAVVDVATAASASAASAPTPSEAPTAGAPRIPTRTRPRALRHPRRGCRAPDHLCHSCTSTTPSAGATGATLGAKSLCAGKQQPLPMPSERSPHPV